jgi:hypothetical protein
MLMLREILRLRLGWLRSFDNYKRKKRKLPPASQSQTAYDPCTLIVQHTKPHHAIRR